MPEHAERRRAHEGSVPLLDAWLRNAAFLLRDGGTVTVIWRAERSDMLLDLLAGAFGGGTLRYIHGKEGQDAIRVIVTANRGRKAPRDILPRLVLNDAQSRPTPESEAVMRSGAAL